MFSERRIRYSLGKTINIGNFESIRIDYSEEVLVNEGIDMDEARYRLKEIVKEELQKVFKERVFVPDIEKGKQQAKNDFSNNVSLRDMMWNMESSEASQEWRQGYVEVLRSYLDLDMSDNTDNTKKEMNTDPDSSMDFSESKENIK